MCNDAVGKLQKLRNFDTQAADIRRTFRQLTLKLRFCTLIFYIIIGGRTLNQ